MTVKNTATMGALRSRQVMHRRQVRYFVFFWTGITLVIGACTFAAVYAATGFAGRSAAALNTTRNITGNLNTNGDPIQPLPGASVALAAQITATSFPITVPTATSEVPTQPPAPTQAPLTPTIPAARDLDFDLGIAVQKNPDPNVYTAWVKMVGEQLRLNWAKSQVVWRDMEKVKGQIDWTELDVAVNQLYDANIRVMLSIAKAPDWARDRGAKIEPGVYDGPPANPQDFVDFLTAILQRYPGKVSAIEVWNEVNLDREWATNPPSINAGRYVELLKAAQAVIKATDSSIIVITAALSPTGATAAGKYTDDFVYMDQLIQAGMLQFADCVGAHHNGLNVPPNADYNNIPERTPRAKYRGPWDNPNHSWAFKTTLEGYAAKIRAAGSSLKLCVTEFGWPSVEDLQGRGTLRDGFGFAADNTLQDQADFTAQAIDLMQQWGFVRLAFLWNLNYGPQAGWQIGGAVGDNVPWSIIGPDYKSRPVWQRIVDMNFRGRPRTAS